MKQTTVLGIWWSTAGAFLLLLLGGVGVHAQDITIVGAGTGDKISIATAGVNVGASTAERQFLQILQTDLKRSGWFTLGAAGASVIELQGNTQVNGSTLEVKCEVLNRATRKSYFARVFREAAAQPQLVAHKLADAIVEAVKGVPGIASTRIALVGSREGKKDLYLIGSDGGGLVQATRDGVPCLSPAWSPDARNIFYTSFLRKFPDVYRIDLGSGNRTRVSGYPGINSGAQVSPDGRHLALILSKDGNPEVYTQDLGSGRVTRITQTKHAAEASPVWSPDGQQLAYVSDVTGAPHIYIINRAGGSPTRITLQGSENVSPSWARDGRLAYSSRRGGRYQICIYDPKTRADRQVTKVSSDHQTPSWAPNSRHLVYARTDSYISCLYILDTEDDSQVKLTTSKGDWYFPAWSPR
ncbi:MAG TPA: hypothetical protein DCS43_09065 [Verrucomicrobia bacterium]|nr:hypothetical protein [Verrucomicrobiota bacterium]